jgi:hypothetical protein
MPFTSDATTHAEQRNKFFMIMALVGLPPELDSVRNQILSGSTPDYESISEQLLLLDLPLLHLQLNPPLLLPITMVVVDGMEDVVANVIFFLQLLPPLWPY